MTVNTNSDRYAPCERIQKKTGATEEIESSAFSRSQDLQLRMGLINKVDMVCLSPVGYGV